MSEPELIAVFKRTGGGGGPLRVQVSPYMQDAKRPVISGSTLYVSPAMYELIVNADEDELKHLLEHLFPIEIPGIERDWILRASL